jgi:hypothetical protein
LTPGYDDSATASAGRDSKLNGCQSCGQRKTVTTSRIARYYDAENRLWVVDARASSAADFVTSPLAFYSVPPVFEEYRYDALGRRVPRRSRIGRKHTLPLSRP